MKIKYFQERERANGMIYVVNPPKYVKAAVGAEYQQFTDREEAITTALRVAEAFQDHKRGKKGTVYVDDSTVEGLIHHYQTTEEFIDLKKNSKVHYRLMFKTAVNFRVGSSNKDFGEIYARSVSPEMVDNFYQQLKTDVSHHRANSTCKVMRRVWNVCMRHGKITINPWHRKRMKGLPTRKVVWDREEVIAAIASADEMNLYNLGTMILLCYHLCQRPGDMRQMTWANYKNNTFRFTQEKTDVEMELDASPDLISRMAHYNHRPKDGLIVPNDENGLPHDRFTYAKQLRRVREHAGIRPELTMADLRRTGATEMAESSCTEDELRAVTGHKSRGILETYVRPSRRMARSGINKRFGV